MEKLPEFLWNHVFLAGIFLLALGLLLWTFLRREQGELSAPEAVRLINDRNVLVLDLRAAAAFTRGHVVNAVHVPVTELPGRIKELERQRADRAVLLFGTPLEQRLARKHLATDCETYCLRGGTLAWETAGLPLIGETTR